MTWLVLDMDEGLLGAYRTRREAVAEHNDAQVLERHKYGHGGAYEYVFGFPGEDATDSVFIEREDVAAAGEWDLAEWVGAGRPLGRWEPKTDEAELADAIERVVAERASREKERLLASRRRWEESTVRLAADRGQ